MYKETSVIYRQDLGDERKALFQRIFDQFKLPADGVAIVLESEDLSGYPNKLWHNRAIHMNLRDGGLEQRSPDHLLKLMESQEYSHLVWFSKGICEAEEQFFAWVVAHELRHLEQDQVSFDLSNAGSFLQCLLGCISDEDSCQNDVPTELDANLKAWSVSHVLFGEDRAKSFVDAQCSGQYGKSFRLSRSQGLGSPYDPVAETIKLLRRHKDDLAREQAKSSKKNIQKFDIDQVCDRLSSNLGLFNLEWLKERFKESASAFPYEIVEGITGEEVCFLESYLGEGDPFKNCEKVFRQINEVFPNKNTDLAECVEKVRFLSRRKVPLAPVFLLLSQAFLEQRIYHRILEASKQEKKPNLSVKRDLDVVLEHGEWLLDQHVARIGEAADNLLDAIYKLEKDRTDIEPHLEPDDDYPLPGLRKWIEEKKIKDLLDKLIEVAEEEAQWPVNWRQALQQIVGKKKIYGTSVEDGFVLRKKPPRVGEYPNDVYNCFEGVHKWIISHSKKHGAQQLTIDLFQTWGFEKMNRERVDRHFRKKK